jgi:hypothetical protein
VVVNSALDVRGAALRRDIARRLCLCNLDENRVLDRVLQRLEVGRERYGHLDLSAPRNWRKERFEERLDALVYDVAEELAAEDVERDQLHEDARREILEWQAEQQTVLSTESTRIALADLASGEPYAEFDLSDAEVS